MKKWIYFWIIMLVLGMCTEGYGQLDNKPEQSSLFQRAEELLKLIKEMERNDSGDEVLMDVITNREMRPNRYEFIQQVILHKNMKYEERLLKKLGMIPSDYNLEEGFLRIYLNPLESYYDYQTSILYIANWIESIHQELTIARELGIALESKKIDLIEFYDNGRSDVDQFVTRQAVVGGRSMGLTISYQMGGESTAFADVPEAFYMAQDNIEEKRSEVPEYTQASDYVREMFLFPYVHGVVFMQKAVKQLGKENLKYLYVEPPTSTEQILHPDKYFDVDGRDEPTPITFPETINSILSLWQPVYATTLGEFRTYLLFNQYNRAIARSAAQGWEGDRIALYDDTAGGQILIYLSEWENFIDTRQFYNGYQSVIKAKYPSAEIVEQTTTSITWQNDFEYIYLMRHKTKVLVLEGVSLDMIEPLTAQLVPDTQ